MSCLERCPCFRGVLIEGFHCTNNVGPGAHEILSVRMIIVEVLEPLSGTTEEMRIFNTGELRG